MPEVNWIGVIRSKGNNGRPSQRDKHQYSDCMTADAQCFGLRLPMLDFTCSTSNKSFTQIYKSPPLGQFDFKLNGPMLEATIKIWSQRNGERCDFKQDHAHFVSIPESLAKPTALLETARWRGNFKKARTGAGIRSRRTITGQLNFSPRASMARMVPIRRAQVSGFFGDLQAIDDGLDAGSTEHIKKGLAFSKLVVYQICKFESWQGLSRFLPRELLTIS